MKIQDFQKYKKENKKISMVTCYDYWSAQLIASTEIDSILVGDSLAMVMHGHSTTLPATLDLMCLHTRAVAQAAGPQFIISDMPFLAHRKNIDSTMDAVAALLQAGAQAIKIEGVYGNEKTIEYIVESGIPVMGHLGLTPQFINQLGGFSVQAQEEQAALKLKENAKRLESAGCFALVLECIPSQLAQEITQELTIPTIGIGAGVFVDGQILVLQDLLGLNPNFKPKFLKQYCSGFSLFREALNAYNQEVKNLDFPTVEQSY